MDMVAKIELSLPKTLFLALVAASATVAYSKPNILFIAIDDLNDWIGCLDGHPQVKTPHMDRLSERGVLFTEAHCPAPVCGPSRTAIMSGMRAWNTGVYSNNANYPKRLPGVESMPQYLRRHGYTTIGAGKLFHGDHSFPDGSFDRYAPSSNHPWPKEAILSSRQTPIYEWNVDAKVITFPRNGMPADRIWKDTHTFDWGPVDLPDHEFRDAKDVAWTIEEIERGLEEPYFLGFGFHLPHQPLHAPKRFHDMYPLDEVELPPHIEGDLDDLSRSGRDYALIPTTSGEHRSVVKYGQWENAVSSYLATVTFVDEMLGKLVHSLESSGQADNTWILLWSDHGWHLGEKEHWGKATGWYRATRVPLMIVPPENGAPKGFTPGSVCHQPVNLIDLYPTLIDIGNLPENSHLDGQSLVPLVASPKSVWTGHTVTTFGRGNHAITGKRWRYIQYFDGSGELYDRDRDPNEWNNLIHDPEYANVVVAMKKKIPEEKLWKQFIRYGDFKAVIPSDGGPMMLFNHAVENHLEERYDESEKYPETVAHIRGWIKRHNSSQRHVVIPEDF